MIEFLLILTDFAMWDHDPDWHWGLALPDWSHYNTLNAMVGFGYSVLSFDPNI